MRREGIAAAVAIMLASTSAQAETGYIYIDAEATYSIIGLDPASGELGVAVQSDTIAVGSRTRWGRGGVAAIASQASSNPMFGEMGVLLLERGWSPEEARDFMVRGDNGALNRQFAIIDMQGRTAAWTSPNITDWKGHLCGENFCVQGNTLTGPDVLLDMAKAFEETEGHLAERLVAGLAAAEAAGGDRRGTQSAGVLVMRPRSIQGYGDWSLDLRVDEHSDPVGELARVLNTRRSQDQLSGLNTLMQNGDFDTVAARIGRALELDPRSSRAFLARADLGMAMEDTGMALEALASAIALNPKAFHQILRNNRFAAMHEDPAFLALGDASTFGPLPPSAPDGITVVD